MEIADRIKAWRHALGLTQDEFARRAGIPKRTLVGYENAEREPGAAALAAIAKTGVNMTWLLTGEGEMLPATPRPPLQVIDGKGEKRAPKEDVARLLKQIEGILATLPAEEARAKVQELYARAREIEEQHKLRQAVADLEQKLAAMGGSKPV